ncbi:hypothetical protein RRG08_063253 [Elysia crispata]|uniref:DUF4139 domain-containing protein n=1 Tax=Elysia crispata TaxID=231223 RepID=A0AAE1CJW8_9GAST|nr:hypothetical protein RRG08_063253 [Elysia crispata]
MAQVSEMNCLYVKALDCPMTKVTVYIDRAEVCRRHECKIKAGKNELHITHFVEADEDSIRVEGHGKATIAEVSFQRNQKKAGKSEEEKALEEKLNNLNKEFLNKELKFESELNGLMKQREILDKFATTASSTGQGDSRDSLLTNEYFQGKQTISNCYGKAGFDEASTAEKACQWTREEETNVTLSISYFVFKASWAPSYDLRMFTVEGTLKIIYYGMISQASGEDWTNVKVLLSTAEPLSVAVPYRSSILQKSLKSARSRGSTLSKGIGEEFVGELDCFNVSYTGSHKKPVNLNVDALKITEGLTSATYEIARLSTIPSDKSSHKVTVANIETRPTLSYLTVPSKVPHAFLEAKVTNTSPYILLPGPTNIFLENTSVGKVRLNAVAPKEEFECSLGVDSGVRVDYKPAAKVTSSSGLISKLKIAQHKQMIEVKNTHAYEIKVKVRENLPRSQDEKIKV